MVNADGSKLSKRQGDIGIKSFREKGYLPVALLNYVVSAGGGFERAQNERPQVYDLQQLASQVCLFNYAFSYALSEAENHFSFI